MAATIDAQRSTFKQICEEEAGLSSMRIGPQKLRAKLVACISNDELVARMSFVGRSSTQSRSLPNLTICSFEKNG